jgi:hypothetical protein
VSVCLVQLAEENIRGRKMRRVGGAYVPAFFAGMYPPIVGKAHTCRQQPSARMRHPRLAPPPKPCYKKLWAGGVAGTQCRTKVGDPLSNPVRRARWQRSCASQPAEVRRTSWRRPTRSNT